MDTSAAPPPTPQLLPPIAEPEVVGAAPTDAVNVAVPASTMQVLDGQAFLAANINSVNALTQAAEGYLVKLDGIDKTQDVEVLKAYGQRYAEAVEVGSRLKTRVEALNDRLEKDWCGPARTLWRNANALKDALTGSGEAILPKLRKATAAARVALERKQSELEEARQEAIRKAEAERQELIRREKELHDDWNAALKEDYEREVSLHNDWVEAIFDDQKWEAAKRERLEAEAQAKKKKEEEDARIRQAEEAEKAGAPQERVEAILATPTPEAPAVAAPPPPPAKVVLPPAPAKPVLFTAPYVPPPPVLAPPPAAAPLLPATTAEQRKTNWKGRILDKRGVLKAILADELPLTEVLEFKQTYFDEQARKHKDKAGLPGVWEAYSEADTAFKKAKE